MIRVLDQNTINKIAAGEVIEKPSSVIKELVENSIDSKATAITVEVKGKGLSFLRVTDNGQGIEKKEVPTAFLRHATSKLSRVEDLLSISSLGFRGEALASIAAVSQVELISKTEEELTGIRYQIRGGKEVSSEEIGCPTGTTIIVRNLFYNTPARKKFMKTDATEISYIYDLMCRISMSHPEISFKFTCGGVDKLFTSGNGKLKDIIYHIYGRDITSNLLEMNGKNDFMKITGYIARPCVSRGNRAFEGYYVNRRYIKSNVITKAIEDAFRTFVMVHKFPFTEIYFEINPELIDVNVHPTKMELKFVNSDEVYRFVYHTVRETLLCKELIPEVSVDKEKPAETFSRRNIGNKPEPFESNRRRLDAESSEGSNPGGVSTDQREQAITRSDNAVVSDTARIRDGINLSDNREASVKPDSAIQEKIDPETGEILGEIQRNTDKGNWQEPEKTLGFDVQNTAVTFGKSPGVANISSENTSAENTNKGNENNENIEIDNINAEKAGTGVENVSAVNTNTGSTSAENVGAVSTSAGNMSIASTVNTSTADISAASTSTADVSISGASPDNIIKNHSSADRVQESAGSFEKSPGVANISSENTIAENTGSADRVQESGEYKYVQQDLFSKSFLSEEARSKHRLIGQLFKTYWLIEYEGKLFIMDQHAAHEKVKFEELMKCYKEKKIYSQYLMPPAVVTLSASESQFLIENMEMFEALGYQVENFGGREYKLNAVPDNLFGLDGRELFLDFIAEASESMKNITIDTFIHKLSTMACKAAIKGNTEISYQEADALVDQLLKLENPYTCPHGRPTVISMTEAEIEKKFKRIV
jgi:DNA mismatch repair protein MutL